MKLEIYEPKEKVKEKEPVRLKLRQTEDGDVHLSIVTKDGEPCITLLSITTEGKIELWPGVYKGGFQNEENGYVKVEKI